MYVKTGGYLKKHYIDMHGYLCLKGNNFFSLFTSSEKMRATFSRTKFGKGNKFSIKHPIKLETIHL